MSSTRRILLSWSSGKDSAWCLHSLVQDPRFEVVGLLTTFNNHADRVAMHAVRRELVNLQAENAGLPLFPVELPWPCNNEDYESAMQQALNTLAGRFDVLAFGDLFLEDIRNYREKQLTAWGYEAVFPLWQLDTTRLAREMVDSGLDAIITCVDPRQCPKEFAGRCFNDQLLDELPDTVDPCGENGEFHTFVRSGPMFSGKIHAQVGETVERDSFVFVDLYR